MEGILAASSTTGNTVGMNRTLTYNCNVTSNRGYLKINDSEDSNEDLNMGNLLSLAEMSVPLVANHDSPMRVNMLTAQNKQSIPIRKSNKMLIKNGSEVAITHALGRDFVFTAKDDGEVIEFNDKDNIMIIQYKDGTKDAINLDFEPAKNGGGGFYLMNKLDTDLQVGDKFKKEQVLAKNNSFFSDNMDGDDVEFSMFKLTKVAVYAGDFTHEDSALVTENYCKDLTSEITMKKEKILTKSSNVDYIIKKGQTIKTGEPLLIFEQGYEESEINMMLDKIADEYTEEITKMSHNQLLSKYTGRVDDIRVYYTCDINDLSPSLQSIVKKYNSTVTSKEKLLKKHFDNINKSNIILSPNEKIIPINGKVKGNEMVDSVMIEFYITYEDELGVGDKIAFSTALKSIISTKIPTELAPYSDYNKDEEIECIMSYISVNARQTTSLYLQLYGNKVLLELKRQVEDIWKS